jgi:hypothetical protein
MSCAINPVSMAHQRRKRFAPLLIGALRKNQWRIDLRRLISLTAHQWRNGAKKPRRADPRFSIVPTNPATGQGD